MTLITCDGSKGVLIAVASHPFCKWTMADVCQKCSGPNGIIVSTKATDNDLIINRIVVLVCSSESGGLYLSGRAASNNEDNETFKFCCMLCC